MQDPSFQTRDWTHAPHSGSAVPTTGLPGKPWKQVNFLFTANKQTLWAPLSLPLDKTWGRSQSFGVIFSFKDSLILIYRKFSLVWLKTLVLSNQSTTQASPQPLNTRMNDSLLGSPPLTILLWAPIQHCRHPLVKYVSTLLLSLGFLTSFVKGSELFPVIPSMPPTLSPHSSWQILIYLVRGRAQKSEFSISP